MNKKVSTINQVLNVIVGSSIGVLIGHGLFVFIDFKKYPEMYAMQGAPWYSSILTYAVFTTVIVGVALIIKGIVFFLNSKH